MESKYNRKKAERRCRDVTEEFTGKISHRTPLLITVAVVMEGVEKSLCPAVGAQWLLLLLTIMVMMMRKRWYIYIQQIQAK